MKHYAMILLNEIVDVFDSEAVPIYPPDPQGNPVIAVECDSEITINDIYHSETNTFEHIDNSVYVPTQLDRIEESLKTSFSEAQQTAIDKYTEELLEGGIL